MNHQSTNHAWQGSLRASSPVKSLLNFDADGHHLPSTGEALKQAASPSLLSLLAQKSTHGLSPEDRQMVASIAEI